MTIIDKINRLRKFQGTYKGKCRRNLRLYEYTPGLSIDDLSDSQVVGYYQRGMFDIESDLTSSIQENIIRSCISTLCSKIASKKVRPFFNTQNGSFRDMQIVKQAQQYFDITFSEQNMNKIVTDAFRDACIFDRGIIYVDRDTHDISRIMPWQVYIDPIEASYNKLTQAAWEQSSYPVSLLSIDLPDYSADTVTYIQYWDLNEHKKYYYIPEVNHFEEEEWLPDVLPFVFLNYEAPIKGTSCTSVVDLLYGIQMEIDDLNATIRDASQRGLGLKYFVPDISNIDTNKITNRAGEIIKYTPIPNQTSVPITSFTDPFMDPQWLQLMQQYKKDASEMVGLSELSRESKKPSGLNSGVALSTMEDIESSRFEVQLNTVIRAYVDIAKLCIEIYDRDADILPNTKWRNNIQWRDIYDSRRNMSIQFSAAEFLSNDPSIKIQQINALVASGYISQSRGSMLMEIPDLQQGYSLANNAINAVMAVIDDCLENDNYNVPDYIPNQILLEEILNTCLSLRANHNAQNAADIDKLMKLYSIAEAKDQEALTSAEMTATAMLSQELQNQINNGAMDQAISQNPDIANMDITGDQIQ